MELNVRLFIYKKKAFVSYRENNDWFSCEIPKQVYDRLLKENNNHNIKILKKDLEKIIITKEE